jgi:hypothetical protein
VRVRLSHSEKSRRFRLSSATVGIEESANGKHVAVTIPSGEIVQAAPNLGDASMMIEVEWNNRKLLMFKIDLVNRGTEV